MSASEPMLGMEPSENRAVHIMRLAFEQADLIRKLEATLEDMTERCRTAEQRARKAEAKRAASVVMHFPLTVPEQDCCPTEMGRTFARDIAMAHELRS